MTSKLIICAYIYHLICIILTSMLVGDYGDALLIISGVLNMIIIAAWIIIRGHFVYYLVYSEKK